MRNAILISTLAAIALSACDYIEGPKVDDTVFPTTGNKVLLEDFTGHKCGNCPRAHEKAAEMLGIHADNLIIVATHVGSFADVDAPNGYPDDFKTTMGNELEAWFDPYAVGLPTGMVNRRPYNNNVLIRHTNWAGAIAAQLAQEPRLDIALTTTFDEASRTLDITTDLSYFEAGDANHHLVVVITEDSVHSQQADYSLPAPSHIEGYMQMHMLRANVTNNTWGEPVKGNTIFAGENIQKSHSITLDPAWEAHHCEVVAYVIDNTTKEVLQAEKTHVMH